MQFLVKISTVYECSLERAFKCPMLCDISKVHTGLAFMPKITHTTDDKDWGKPGSFKKVFAAKSWTQPGGFISIDRVIERIENKYWKIEVTDFQSWMLGFYKFTGEWATTEIAPGKVRVDYTYTLHANVPVLYPFCWLFAKLFWGIYMKQILENVQQRTVCR
jgi:hypothetical protein